MEYLSPWRKLYHNYILPPWTLGNPHRSLFTFLPDYLQTTTPNPHTLYSSIILLSAMHASILLLVTAFALAVSALPQPGPGCPQCCTEVLPASHPRVARHLDALGIVARDPKALVGVGCKSLPVMLLVPANVDIQALPAQYSAQLPSQCVVRVAW